jgi:tetratricopeptide (TPR) repeat protein
MVEAQRHADRHAEGLAVLDRLAEAAPNDAELARARAGLLSDLGRDEEALEALERAYATSREVGAELAQALERAVARAEPPMDRTLTLRLIEVLEQSNDIEGARARLWSYQRSAASRR